MYALKVVDLFGAMKKCRRPHCCATSSLSLPLPTLVWVQWVSVPRDKVSPLLHFYEYPVLYVYFTPSTTITPTIDHGPCDPLHNYPHPCLCFRKLDAEMVIVQVGRHAAWNPCLE